MYYDIDETLARRAHEAAHQSDYTPNSATGEYRQMVDSAAAMVARKKARVSPYYHEKMDAMLDAYARRLAKWFNDYNRNAASCPSVLIAGPANFPVKKKQKQNAREDTLMEEYREIKKYLDRVLTVGNGPVDLADPHARELLTEQLQAVVKEREQGKAMNAYFRKHDTMKGYPGFTDTDAARMDERIKESVSWARAPYPPYELTSLRDKEKRLRARLAELDKLEAAVAEKVEGREPFDGGYILHNAELNRLQIIFEGKPDGATRAELKRRGFHWSPSNGAWQRQLTHNAECDARQIVGLQ